MYLSQYQLSYYLCWIHAVHCSQDKVKLTLTPYGLYLPFQSVSCYGCWRPEIQLFWTACSPPNVLVSLCPWALKCSLVSLPLPFALLLSFNLTSNSSSCKYLGWYHASCILSMAPIFLFIILQMSLFDVYLHIFLLCRLWAPWKKELYLNHFFPFASSK